MRDEHSRHLEYAGRAKRRRRFGLTYAQNRKRCRATTPQRGCRAGDPGLATALQNRKGGDAWPPPFSFVATTQTKSYLAGLFAGCAGVAFDSTAGAGFSTGVLP